MTYTPTARIAINLDYRTAEQLTAMARRRGVHRTEFIGSILASYVRHATNPARQGDLINPQPQKEQQQ